MPQKIKILPLIRRLSKSVWLGTGKAKTGRESLLLVVGRITSFRLVLVHFESLRILVHPKDLNICFSQQ